MTQKITAYHSSMGIWGGCVHKRSELELEPTSKFVISVLAETKMLEVVVCHETENKTSFCHHRRVYFIVQSSLD